MSKLIGFLFPWRSTYRRLELQQRWWHRLAIVVFFVALIPALLFSWAIADDAYAPVNQFNTDVKEWTRAPNSPTGDWLQLHSDSDPASPVIQKSIEMPDGKTAWYPATESNDSIQADWQHKRSIAATKAASFSFGWAILAALVFSYLLQAAYRALLFVIFGSKAEAIPAEKPSEGITEP